MSITPLNPNINTVAGGTVVIGSGTKLTDVAVLAGGFNPTGTITFYCKTPVGFDQLELQDLACDAVREATGIAPEKTRDVATLRAVCAANGIPVEKGWGWGKLVTQIFDEEVEPTCIQPTFITHYPVDVSPLSRRNAEDPTLVKNIVADGCEKARKLARETMREVREVMGLSYS